MRFSVSLFLLLLAIVVSESRPQIDTQTRIVGGSNAPDGAYPYQVSLRSSTNGAHFCGGSIISPNWILTAAQCVYGQPPNMVVVVGTNLLDSGGFSYGVAAAKYHEGYNPQNNVNDIAVLQISGAISYGPKVQRIGLATLPVLSGTSLNLTGWGLTSYPGQSPPNALQQITLTSIAIPQCQNTLPGYPVFDTHICTYDGVGRGPCKGDSGGPLVRASPLGTVQVGIASWGLPCARGLPDVFTSVVSYRPWIMSITGVIF